jgi:hypothetical protein
MRALDKIETIKWLSERRVLVDSNGKPTFSGLVQAIDSAIPGDSGRKTALSRAIVAFFDADDEALLWINEFGIWPSAEDWNLFEGFRRSLGEDSPLSEKPGHIFSNKDLTNVGSLLAMIFYFVWGAVLYSPAKGLGIVISHDEFISVFARDKSDAAGITATLRKHI